MLDAKRYFLVPNYDEFPEDGPLFLGSIIANPKLPQKSLNEDCRQLPKTEKVITGTPFKDWRSTIKRGDHGEFSLWARLLQMITAGFASRYELSEEDEFRFDLMTTKFFYPSDAYLTKAMSRLNVQRHLKAMSSANQEPLYMVIGLKTVQGATIMQTINRGSGRNGNMSVDVVQGGGVSVGGGGQSSSSRIETRRFETSAPHVIGFRIREIRINQDKSVVQSDITEGAYFGVRDTEDSTEKRWLVVGLGGQDCGKDVAPDLVMSFAIDDQEGYCQCIY